MLACIRMNILHKIWTLLILMIIFSNDLSSQTVDSIPRLKIYASLNGYTSGEHTIDWFIQQNCLRLEIDTILVVANKQEYIDWNLKRLKKIDKGLRGNKTLINEHIARLGLDYDKYMPLDTYDYFSKGRIKGFKLSGSRCCFVTSADSKTNCLSESQINYLRCLLNGDRFWISDIKVLVSDSLYDFNSAVQFKMQKKNTEQPSIDYEIETINSIFPDIVDFGQFFRIIGMQMPKLDTIYDDKGKLMGYDTEKYKKEIEAYNNYYSDIKSTDTNKMVLAVIDTLFTCWRPETISLLLSDTTLEDYYTAIESYINCKKSKTKIDIENITNSGVFIVRNRNEFPKELPSRKQNYDFSFSGYLAFSHVFYNEDKTKGVVFYMYLCGSTCGNTNLLLLKKNNDKWMIDKIEELGVF